MILEPYHWSKYRAADHIQSARTPLSNRVQLRIFNLHSSMCETRDVRLGNPTYRHTSVDCDDDWQIVTHGYMQGVSGISINHLAIRSCEKVGTLIAATHIQRLRE